MNLLVLTQVINETAHIDVCVVISDGGRHSYTAELTIQIISVNGFYEPEELCKHLV